MATAADVAAQDCKASPGDLSGEDATPPPCHPADASGATETKPQFTFAFVPDAASTSDVPKPASAPVHTNTRPPDIAPVKGIFHPKKATPWPGSTASNPFAAGSANVTPVAPSWPSAKAPLPSDKPLTAFAAPTAPSPTAKSLAGFASTLQSAGTACGSAPSPIAMQTVMSLGLVMAEGDQENLLAVAIPKAVMFPTVARHIDRFLPVFDEKALEDAAAPATASANATQRSFGGLSFGSPSAQQTTPSVVAVKTSQGQGIDWRPWRDACDSRCITAHLRPTLSVSVLDIILSLKNRGKPLASQDPGAVSQLNREDTNTEEKHPAGLNDMWFSVVQVAEAGRRHTALFSSMPVLQRFIVNGSNVEDLTGLLETVASHCPVLSAVKLVKLRTNFILSDATIAALWSIPRLDTITLAADSFNNHKTVRTTALLDSIMVLIGAAPFSQSPDDASTQAQSFAQRLESFSCFDLKTSQAFIDAVYDKCPNLTSLYCSGNSNESPVALMPSAVNTTLKTVRFVRCAMGQKYPRGETQVRCLRFNMPRLTCLKLLSDLPGKGWGLSANVTETIEPLMYLISRARANGTDPREVLRKPIFSQPCEAGQNNEESAPEDCKDAEDVDASGGNGLFFGCAAPPHDLKQLHTVEVRSAQPLLALCFFATLPRLKSLTLVKAIIGPKLLALVQRFPVLERLTFSEWHFAPPFQASLAGFAVMPHVKHLSFAHCQGPDAAAMRRLRLVLHRGCELTLGQERFVGSERFETAEEAIEAVCQEDWTPE